MDPICEGSCGAAVEDIQERLVSLGYQIDQDELDKQLFGASTKQAVARFRVEHDLMVGTNVDESCWSVLVDETYSLGDRTLYLRLPNFHGRDVRDLQTRLNILGFSCGEIDGYFGAFTEAAVKQFQENVGVLADGMTFPETYDAIERLRHVWSGPQANGSHPTGSMGFARAAGVLESVRINLTAEDPIARNIAGRILNLASATTEQSQLSLIDNPQDIDGEVLLILGSTPVSIDAQISNVLVDDSETLPQRIFTAFESSVDETPVIRLEVPVGEAYDGTFTISDAQTFAVSLLDAICAAFDEI